MTATIATAIPASAAAHTVSPKARLAGRIVSGVVVALLLLDSLSKLAQVQEVVDASVALGIPTGQVPVIGAILLACIALYVVPRTSILGAVFLTSYFGGAVMLNNMMNEKPLFSTVLSAAYVGVFVWLGLWLRDGRVRAIVASIIGR
ncbi:DoxX family protein [Antrihabitans sp. YC3-6]|uniref:DoxX family protein n=1 Tax=Antrihabitans stalagmiti TaxID=2799499 RepID=A0A934NPB9_9NOCA|nr:DoxX family protein [Antrihabitans stalagmiti]MBJ8338888.1 DoxX family protein [Antrihabitans stalagmiti]